MTQTADTTGTPNVPELKNDPGKLPEEQIPTRKTNDPYTVSQEQLDMLPNVAAQKRFLNLLKKQQELGILNAKELADLNILSSQIKHLKTFNPIREFAEQYQFSKTPNGTLTDSGGLVNSLNTVGSIEKFYDRLIEEHAQTIAYTRELLEPGITRKRTAEINKIIKAIGPYGDVDKSRLSRHLKEHNRKNPDNQMNLEDFVDEFQATKAGQRQSEQIILRAGGEDAVSTQRNMIKRTAERQERKFNTAIGKTTRQLEKFTDASNFDEDETLTALQNTIDKEWAGMGMVERDELMTKHQVSDAWKAKKYEMAERLEQRVRQAQLKSEKFNTPENAEILNNLRQIKEWWTNQKSTGGVNINTPGSPPTRQLRDTENFSLEQGQTAIPAIPYNNPKGAVGTVSASINSLFDVIRRRLKLPIDTDEKTIIAYGSASSDDSTNGLVQRLLSLKDYDNKRIITDGSTESYPQPRQWMGNERVELAKKLDGKPAAGRETTDLLKEATKKNVSRTKAISRLRKAFDLPIDADEETILKAASEAFATRKVGVRKPKWQSDLVSILKDQPEYIDMSAFKNWDDLLVTEQQSKLAAITAKAAAKGRTGNYFERLTPTSKTFESIARARVPVESSGKPISRKQTLLSGQEASLTPFEADRISTHRQHISIGNEQIKIVSDNNQNFLKTAVPEIVNALKNTKTFETPQLNIIAKQLRSAKTPEEVNKILSSALGDDGNGGLFTRQMFAAAPFAATPLLQSNSSREKESRPNAPRLTFAP